MESDLVKGTPRVPRLGVFLLCQPDRRRDPLGRLVGVRRLGHLFGRGACIAPLDPDLNHCVKDIRLMEQESAPKKIVHCPVYDKID